MKKIISAAILSSLLLFSSLASAELKIAVVDVVAVLQKMPQRETVSNALMKEFEPKLNAIKAAKEKADTAAQKIQKEGMTLSESEKLKLSNVIQDFEDAYQNYMIEYKKRENEETNKLLDKILKTIDDVAKKDKYDLVLRLEAALYTDKQIDITDKIIAQVKK